MFFINGETDQMTRTTPPTLEDVAKAAGVSTASISRAINDPDKVSKPTRKRIQEAIDKLGYTPNFGGRALASNKTNTIGAIIPSMANAMFASGLQAFQEALSESGINLLVASSGYDPEQELRQIKSLIGQGADGLLLIGDMRPEKTNEFLRLRNIPVVQSWAFESGSQQNSVGFDNAKAAYNMTRHVLEFGHLNIAMISGISENNDRATNRIKGVQSAIADFDQGARLIGVIETRYLLENGSEALDALMSADEKPTAIICGNDVLAAGAVVQAKARGLSVPGDVSITGFDDIGLALVSDPPLTTVRVPQIEMGRAAAKALIDIIAGNETHVSVEFETEIIQRGSLGPPKA